jgi:hypothetical protein
MLSSVAYISGAEWYCGEDILERIKIELRKIILGIVLVTNTYYVYVVKVV